MDRPLVGCSILVVEDEPPLRSGRDSRTRSRGRARPHSPKTVRCLDDGEDPALSAAVQPIQNAFAESFIGRLRDELLNETSFRSLSHARELLKVICQAFDDAWIEIAPTVTNNPLAVEAAD